MRSEGVNVSPLLLIDIVYYRQCITPFWFCQVFVNVLFMYYARYAYLAAASRNADIFLRWYTKADLFLDLARPMSDRHRQRDERETSNQNQVDQRRASRGGDADASFGDVLCVG
jgi:hypothetical protein